MVFNPFSQFPEFLRSLWPQSAIRLSKKGERLREQGKLDEAVAVLDRAIGLDSQLADAYAQRCACYCDREEYAKAIEDADRAIALDPKMARAYWGRSWSQYQLDELDSALADMDEALRLEPQSAIFQHSRAQVLLGLGRIDEAAAQYEAALVQDPDLNGGWLGGELAHKQGKWKEAIELFDAALEAHPSAARVYCDRADAWYRLNECEKALRDIDEAVKLEPEAASYQCFRAQVLLKLGRIEEASAQYESALVQDPDFRRTWVGGAIALKQGKFREAIEHFDAMLEADPTNARVYYDRGDAWYRLYEYESALRSIDEAVKLEPEVAVYLRFRARVLLELGRIDEATAQYESALVQDPDFKGGWLGGAIALKQGKFREAVEQFDTVLEIDATSPRVYYDRAEAWYRLHESENALRDLDEAIRLAPEIAAYQSFRVWVLLESGRVDEAVAQYEAALVQDPEFERDWLGGAIALKQGKFREAIDQLDAALEIEPTRPRAYFDRAEAWYRLREYENALRDLDEAIRLKPEVAVYQCFRARILLELGRVDEASAQYEAALVQDPEPKDRSLGGEIALKQRKWTDAIEQFNTVLETDSTYSLAYHYRGEAWYRLGEYENALADFGEAVRFAPDCIRSHMFLAWIKATCPEDDFRNGKQAVAMAHKAVELAGGKPDSRRCAVLAAAYAEDGDFAEAIRWQTEALATATDKQQPKYQARLEQYQAGMPHRMPDSEDSES